MVAESGGRSTLSYMIGLFQWLAIALMMAHIIQEQMTSMNDISQTALNYLNLDDPTSTSKSLSLSASSSFSGSSPSISGSVLDIPQGEAVALPSVRVEAEKEIDRKFYGGKGDKAHLGGFTEYDGQGVSPAVWKFMLEYVGVQSLLDVGCGRGISTSWFVLHGVDTYCVEGSHDAVMQSIIPDADKRVTEHDFSRGPWWPPTTVDAAWCVEFLEHVGRNFHRNYLPAMRKAAIIFATSSNWGGWHHVEVHDTDWWVQKFEMYGFRYSKFLSDRVRGLARKEVKTGLGPDGKNLNAQHVWLNMKVFINPVVAALPQHAHLLAEHGCFGGREGDEIVHRECGPGIQGRKEVGKEESKIPESFYPIKITPEMDKAWEELIKRNIQPKI